MSIFAFTPAPYIRPRGVIGGGLDIPFGRYYKGKYGDNLLSGGYTNFLGAGGRGNTFKTLLLLTIAIIEMSQNDEYTLVIYDTEITMDWNRLRDICAQLGVDYDAMLDAGRIIITTTAEHMGNEWFELVKEEGNARAKDKSLLRETPFLNRDGKPIKVVVKRTHFLDSMSEFTTEHIQDIYKKNEIDDGGATTDNMREGGVKTRMIRLFPAITAKSNMSILCTAHVGDEIKVDTYAAFKQQLMHLKKGLKFKNCPEKFTFLTSIMLVIGKAELLQHDDKTQKYPAKGFTKSDGDTDLQELDIVVVRSKHGPSGHNYTLIVSQAEGFLPELSNYHNLIQNKAFGLVGPEGQRRSWRCALYPDVLIHRTEARWKVKEDKKLACALELTYNLSQMYDYWVNYPREEMVEPTELYTRLKEMGYDWDLLLQTRNWWTYDDYKHPIPRLTALDLIDMYFGRYVPYWWPKDKPIDLTKAVKSPLTGIEGVVYGAADEDEKDGQE